MSAPASQEAPRPEVPAAETSPETSDGARPLTRPVSHAPGLVVLGAGDAEACSDGTCW
ncbi:hypothetical protein [Planotetraspora mira]|uniref:Uncharacterized protein n=1 Tax=Planotetraspora mira TaxID=58121 RepID=A0A8J3TXP1_9ACTN|nr:hypothetical protein [Planotetraspora mira]GII34406.1 hypothetical protein Pmi06nite_78480 [Planotetraspora mira]